MRLSKLKMLWILVILMVAQKPIQSQQLIIGAGVTPFSPYYSFSQLRLKVGVTNIFKNFGAYGMWEVNPYNSYGRDAVGINYQLSCLFRVWAGVGIFEKGLIRPQNTVNPLNGLRKEMGIGYIARSRPIQWELGYSFTLGPTFQIYYEIPLVKKDRNGDGKYNNIDRSRPCVLEWERRDSTVEYIVDTIYIDPKLSQPICANPLPIDSFNDERATNTTFYLPVAYEKDQVMLNTDIKEKLKYYLVGILSQRTDLIVEIGSHTECDGRSLFNLQLTQRRADSIARFMNVEYGLDTSRMIAKGYGEFTPINHCNCEGGDVVGFTPYYPGVTLKQTPNFNRMGQFIGNMYTEYESTEIDTFGGKLYIKCDDFQKRQNNRITLRFKRKLRHFARIKDTCDRPLDTLVPQPKNCRDHFELGSLSYYQLTNQTATQGIFDLPLTFDRSNTFLNDKTKLVLDSFAKNFLIPNSQFVLEIGTHTDCRQSKSYNDQVSQKRAEEIRMYLFNAHKIDSNRIVAKGYGENYLINSCNCEGTEINAYTPHIAGLTQKLETEFDARGNAARTYLTEYSPREIRVIDGNPFVACNDKQHKQSVRTTLRIDTSFYNICIDKPYTPLIIEPEMDEGVMAKGIDIDQFEIEKAYSEIYTLPIFYDLDKAVIRPDAQRVLDTFAVKILLKYPFLVCELGSHTDCRMPYDYNERLSKRRADSAVAYLKRVWKIGSNRIIAKGYGEENLLNECHCEDALAVEYTPYIEGRTRKMLVDLDDEGNVIGTIYQDYKPSEIVYFDNEPFVKCEEFQHRQNRRTTVRFTQDPAKFGIKIDLEVDKNNTNASQSKYYERLRKGGKGHIREQVEEFRYQYTDINNFKIDEATLKAYALPIFYDLDKAIIRPDAQRVLDSFAVRILNKYPKLIVELGSHTDCRMPYDYNERLSKRRADSAVDYLIRVCKIDPKRIVAVGYGEHQTINECACEENSATSYTPYIPGKTKKMLLDLDDDGNVSETLYLEYEPNELTYIEGVPHVKCEEYQHRQNRRTTVRFANDPRDFGIEIDVDIDQNNINKRK